MTATMKFCKYFYKEKINFGQRFINLFLMKIYTKKSYFFLINRKDRLKRMFINYVAIFCALYDVTYVSQTALLEATTISKVLSKLGYIEVRLIFSCRRPRLTTMMYNSSG